MEQQINDAIRILGKRSLAAGEIVSEKLAVQLLANKVRYLRWLYISCLAVSNEGREHLVPLTDTSISVLEIRRFLPIFELRTLLDDQFQEFTIVVKELKVSRYSSFQPLKRIGQVG